MPLRHCLPTPVNVIAIYIKGHLPYKHHALSAARCSASSDKASILEFAHSLSQRGVELLSIDGTARLLAEVGLPVTEVSDYTGFPEIMDGRVKTLHPKVHGSILGRRNIDDAVMHKHDIAPIDMAVVKLYPFAATVARAYCTREEAVREY